MPDDNQPKKGSSAEEDLLKQCREDFQYCKSYWMKNMQEAEKDMDCMACIPPEDFRADRTNRPCIWPDETSQYVKQANNNLRQNKRSIKLSPKSDGANAKDAEHRQAYIRGIEDASSAQAVYTSAFEAATESAFGFFRLKLIVVSKEGHQEPRLARIPNQFTVYMDPEAIEPDFSDSNLCFVQDCMREKTFKRRYPKAKKTSFTDDDRGMAPDFFMNENVVVVEWWKREELDQNEYKVTQRITNGVEIIETNEWIGSWIPIIGVFGEELYVRQAGQSKRIFMSMIRRARAAQQMMAYFASQEAEEFGMAPRAPLQGYKGQFDPEQHAYIHKVPKAYVEFNLPDDWNPAWGPPPLPTRIQFIPNAQAYEIGYERWRRSHQAAMGITPLPTAAQRQNEKSGVALERIQTQQAIGAFHFQDNFARALHNTGMQLDELITKLGEMDSLPSEILGRDQKGEDVQIKVARSNQERGNNPEKLPEDDNLFFPHIGRFEVTISDGPSYESQREEASDFADHLIANLPALQIPPQITQAILAIAVKLKNIGAYGDEIHDLLAPPDPQNLPPQAKAILAQSQGMIQQLKAELQKLQLEKLGKVTEIEGKKQIVALEHVSKMAEADKDRETKTLVAEIETKAQNLSERMTLFADMMKQWHQQAHEIASQMQQQQHEKDIAAQQAQAAQAQQATQIAADQQAQSNQPEAEQ